MFKFTIENENGEKLRLTQNSAYFLLSVDGLNPPGALVNIASNANFDGGVVKNARLGTRVITFTLAINNPAETNRIALYNFIKTKRAVTVYVENGQRNVYTNGIVESFNIVPFSEKETAQISIVCPKPYFYDKADNSISFAIIQPGFEFPFSIPSTGIAFSELDYNIERVIGAGDIASGMIIEFYALGNSTNPVFYNATTGEFIKVETSLTEGQVLYINTFQGEKTIKLIDGLTETNLINALTVNSAWVGLAPGTNVVYFGADSNPENLSVTMAYHILYEGV